MDLIFERNIFPVCCSKHQIDWSAVVEIPVKYSLNLAVLHYYLISIFLAWHSIDICFKLQLAHPNNGKRDNSLVEAINECPIQQEVR